MIVVTGLGAVTSLGRTADETWQRLVRGERGLGALSLFDAEGYRSRIVAEVSEVRPEAAQAEAEPGSVFSRTSELGLMAAREALAGAGLTPGGPRSGGTAGASWGGLRVGLVMGGSTAGMFETESVLGVLVGPEGTLDPRARDTALTRMLRHPLSAPTDRLARELGPFSRVRSLSSACSSGATAMVVGASWLDLDLVDVVLCGAADALCRITMSGFGALGVVDEEGARPFDGRRRGLTLGEGAGFLVLERRETAERRGAPVLCALAGWAARSEAHHITNPEPTGRAAAAAMRAALARAGLGPSDIDCVNAHGTGTRLNDPMEARALRDVFGDDVRRIPVTSCKGQIGHTLGAAGAIEAVLTVLSVTHDVVPPTGGLSEPDPACALRHVLTAETRPVRAALSSSFGFGGMDAVLVFSKTPANEAPVAGPTHRRIVVTGVSTFTPGTLLVGAAVGDLPGLAQAAAGDSDLTEFGLDPTRARRLDRAARLATLAVEGALGDAGDGDVGIVLGSAFGPVDASAAFMRRLADKGPRLVSPADFPALVPSSPAGFVSIYLGLTGPSMVVADLATSGECAFTQAFELVARGEAPRVVASAVEERSAIVEGVLRVLFDEGASAEDGGAATTRRYGSAAVALADADVATRAGLGILAEISTVVSWTAEDCAPLASLEPPPPGALVVHGAPSARVAGVLDASPWAACARVSCGDHAGTHEAVGAIAIAVAAAKVSRGEAPATLCLGTARGSGYAVVLRRWAP